MTREFVVLPDANAVAAATADRLLAAGQEAIDDHGTFHLVLTGGSTPQLVCPLLVVPPRVLQLDWTKVEFFFGDERAVPARHPDSNYNTARQRGRPGVNDHGEPLLFRLRLEPQH